VCLRIHFRPSYLLEKVLYLLLLLTLMACLAALLWGQTNHAGVDTGLPTWLNSIGLVTGSLGLCYVLYRRDLRKDERIEKLHQEATERLVDRALSLQNIVQKQDAEMDQIIHQMIQNQLLFGKTLDTLVAALEKVATAETEIKEYLLKAIPTPHTSRR
jgi:hypothetical protein